MGNELLSADEAQELIRLVEAEPAARPRIDPQHALVLFGLKLIAPIDGDKAKGYAPTRAGILLARKLSRTASSDVRPAAPGPHPHLNTDPYWPFPIRVL